MRKRNLTTINSNLRSITQTLFIMVGAVAAIYIAYLPSTLQLVELWSRLDGNQSHGFLVFAIVLFLFHRFFSQQHANSQTQNSDKNVYFLGLIALTASSASWALAVATNIDALAQCLLLGIFISLIWLVLGYAAALRAVPILGILLLAMPVWDQAIPILVDISVSAVSFALSFSNVPVLISENTLYMTHGQIDVADGCSGIRYLMVAATLATYAMAISQLSLQKKIVVFSLMTIAAIIVNWIRIYIIVLIAHYTKMQSPVVQDHEFLGWIIFLIFIVVPFSLVGRSYLPNQTKLITFKWRSSFFMIITVLGAMTLGRLTLFLILYGIDYEKTTLDLRHIGYKIVASPPQEILNIPVGKVYYQSKNVNLSSAISVNWRSSAEDELVPYFRKITNDNWMITKRQTIKVKEYDLYLLTLERKPFGQFACAISWYMIGREITSNYQLTKLFQLEALLRKENEFLGAYVVAESALNNCTNEIGSLAGAVELVLDATLSRR